MKICVGSKNEVKIQAVAEAIADYALFEKAEVRGADVAIDEFGHPKSLEETVSGAISRATQAFVDCDFSFGIESGIMPVAQTKTGYMEVTACAIYDGKEFHLGLSPAFEWPRKITELILGGRDGSQAWKEAGMSDSHKVGNAEGAIWHLTNGRINRKDYTKAAITMALIHLEHPEHF